MDYAMFRREVRKAFLPLVAAKTPGWDDPLSLTYRLRYWEEMLRCESAFCRQP